MYIISGKSSDTESKKKTTTEYSGPDTGSADTGADRLAVTGGELGSVPYSGRLAGHVLPSRRPARQTPARRPEADSITERTRFRRHIRGVSRKGASAKGRGGAGYAVLYAMITLFTVGFVTGCAVWRTPGAREQCGSIAEGYMSFARGCGFAECFSAGFARQLPVFLMLAACSLMVVGCAGCAVLLFIRGMGSAIALCSLLSGGLASMSSPWAAPCAALYIAASAAVLILTARDASGMSLGIAVRGMAGRGAGQWISYAARLAVYALLLAAGAALHAAMVCLLCG